MQGGPGTGKTWVLRERFARRVESGADPDRVVFVAGSRPARDATKAWLLERLPGSSQDLQVLTMHGLANRVLRISSQARGQDPPEVLTALDQFARVREMLTEQDPQDWPAYGSMLGLEGFADELRQFLRRAQEALLTPEDIEVAAAARGLTGWAELARFLGQYREAMTADNVVDFASMVARAAAEAAELPPLLDEVLVDDYQDVTLASERLLLAVRARSLVVAADPGGHVFSFQGTSSLPLERFTEMFSAPGGSPGSCVELTTQHRSPAGIQITAWVAPDPADEYAAIARELRRSHVEDDVPWSEMAVVVRRQSTGLAGLLRALEDAGIPRSMPERALALSAEAATRPYVLALRWLVADPPRRAELIEQLLTSDAVGLSPAGARGLLRAATGSGGPGVEADVSAVFTPPTEALESLDPAEAEAVRVAGDALTRAGALLDDAAAAFRVLWEDLPCSHRLVARAERDPESAHELDTVVALADLVTEVEVLGQGDRSIEAFLDALDARENGPGRSAWERGRADAVRVLTAHGTIGREFDLVVVAGAAEGNFPSLSRPEPMFDLDVLERVVTNADRAGQRLADERRLFGVVLGRARRRVVLACSDPAWDEDAPPPAGSRFVAERALTWVLAPAGCSEEPVSVAEATAAWRRRLADPAEPAPERLAALEGLIASGTDPATWWFRHDWTDTGQPLHETLRVSYSRLSNLEDCELRHVLSDELGLGVRGGYHAWVGHLVHTIAEDAEQGVVEKQPRALAEAVDARWRPQEFPSRAVSEAFRQRARMHMIRNWFETYGATPALATEEGFSFEIEGATVVGFIDRIGPAPDGRGTVITDFKTGKADRAGPAEDNLQLGIYYLAVQEAPELAEYQPVRSVELAFLRGHWRDDSIEFRRWEVSEGSEDEYQRRVREKLAELIRRKRAVDEAGEYRPNPLANCMFCEFKSLCSLYPEGQPVFPLEEVRA